MFCHSADLSHLLLPRTGVEQRLRQEVLCAVTGCAAYLGGDGFKPCVCVCLCVFVRQCVPVKPANPLCCSGVTPPPTSCKIIPSTLRQRAIRCGIQECAAPRRHTWWEAALRSNWPAQKKKCFVKNTMMFSLFSVRHVQRILQREIIACTCGHIQEVKQSWISNTSHC